MRTAAILATVALAVLACDQRSERNVTQAAQRAEQGIDVRVEKPQRIGGDAVR